MRGLALLLNCVAETDSVQFSNVTKLEYAHGGTIKEGSHSGKKIELSLP